MFRSIWFCVPTNSLPIMLFSKLFMAIIRVSSKMVAAPFVLLPTTCWIFLLRISWLLGKIVFVNIHFHYISRQTISAFATKHSIVKAIDYTTTTNNEKCTVDRNHVSVTLLLMFQTFNGVSLRPASSRQLLWLDMLWSGAWKDELDKKANAPESCPSSQTKEMPLSMNTKHTCHKKQIWVHATFRTHDFLEFTNVAVAAYKAKKLQWHHSVVLQKS